MGEILKCTNASLEMLILKIANLSLKISISIFMLLLL